ncbi:MAG: hypothetical protein V4627_18390 [Pseudomonadota bacterium]
MSNYGPPHLQRRTLLKLGIASAVVLAVAGGAVALMQPGIQNGKLSEGARLIFARAGETILAGTLPADEGPKQIAINSLLDRIEAFIAGTPDHVQAELSQLLGLLNTAAGRRGVVGLSAGWHEASVGEIATAFQAMRVSSVSLRVQAYQGLHDIVSASYFSGQESWAVLGYPGPRAI